MILELRVYTLKPDTRGQFQIRAQNAILPMLARHGIRVVAARPSLHDAASFCLLRAYRSQEERERQIDAFYGSEEWLTEHDEAVMAMIENYSTCVMECDERAVDALAAALA